MKFRTKIEIISEAADKRDAIEIVGDYLSGNIASGVEMKCSTKPVRIHHNEMIAASIISICLIGGSLLFANAKQQQQGVIGTMSGISAIQPQLKTACVTNPNQDFKKSWELKQNKAALDRLTK